MNRSAKARRARAKKRKSRTDSPKSVSARMFVVVVLLAVAGLGWILWESPALDRPVLAVFIVFIVGMALVIVGGCNAAGEIAIDTHGVLCPKTIFSRGRRIGTAIEQVVYPLLIVWGMINMCLHPKQTWPAILWVGSGVLLMLVSIGILAIFAA